MSTNTEPDQPDDQVTDRPREWSTRAFLAFLGVISGLYATLLIYHISNPVDKVRDNSSLLEQCRQLCMQYGLITTGNVRRDAEAWLEVVQSHKLTEGLAVVLADREFTPTASQTHPLLNQPAPDFKLPDVQGVEQSLGSLGGGRPVVVVFYLGYSCSHCVAQLLALDKDLHYFRELDARVVAISSDSPQHTAEKYQEYGEFRFPVLADVDYSVSEQWGVYRPETAEQSEFLNHGTFVVDGKGRLIWATLGREPFLDNTTLLHVIAGSQGLLPSAPNSGAAAAVARTGEVF
jgi:peroxiredoxin Q/BCP